MGSLKAEVVDENTQDNPRVRLGPCVKFGGFGPAVLAKKGEQTDIRLILFIRLECHAVVGRIKLLSIP